MAVVQHKPSRGMTLVELTIVLLILGILAGVAAPRFADAMLNARVRGAAQCVVSDLERARQWAKSHGVAQTVVFSPSTNSYELTGMAHADRAGRAFVVDVSAAPYEATMASAGFGDTGTDLTVTFNRFGRPDGFGWVVVAVGEHQKTVLLDGLSGRASIQP